VCLSPLLDLQVEQDGFPLCRNLWWWHGLRGVSDPAGVELVALALTLQEDDDEEKKDPMLI